MFYYMAKSVFAMRLVNVCSPKLAMRTKISKQMLILQFLISKKGLKKFIRCLSTMRTWMLTSSVNIVTVKYL